MKIRRFIFIFFIVVIVLVSCVLLLFKTMVILDPPVIIDKSALNLKREQFSDSLYLCNDSWLHQSESGLWEMYITGSAYEMGVKNGILTQELATHQEQEFFDFIMNLIPSKATLNYLKYFIAWFNKDLDCYVPIELQEEIYGVSEFASNDFEFIAPNYNRILNYHAAQDIGHTIQNMNLIACTTFGVKDKKTIDSSLLIGRATPT